MSICIFQGALWPSKRPEDTQMNGSEKTGKTRCVPVSGMQKAKPVLVKYGWIPWVSMNFETRIRQILLIRGVGDA